MKLTKQKTIYKTIKIKTEPKQKIYNNNTFVDGYELNGTMIATFRVTVRG